MLPVPASAGRGGRRCCDAFSSNYVLKVWNRSSSRAQVDGPYSRVPFAKVSTQHAPARLVLHGEEFERIQQQLG